MLLGHVTNQSVFTLDGRHVVRIGPNHVRSRQGKLPIPATENQVKSRLFYGAGKSIIKFLSGRYQSSNLWGSGDGPALANFSNYLYASVDGGETWKPVRQLPESSPPKGVLPGSVEITDQAIYLCEYPIGTERARVLWSEDEGYTWNVYYESENYRHFHGIYTDPYSDSLWGNTGDRDSESSIGRFQNGEYHPIGSGSQQWRAVEIAFTPDSIIWGKDALFAATKEIYRLDREQLALENPKPTVVGETKSVLFYLETIKIDGEHWVIASTSSQPGIDSTAKAGNQASTCPRTNRVLAASEQTGFTEWYEILRLDRRRALGDYTERIPITDSHIFIDVDESLGVFANPYNTRTFDGALLRFQPESIPQLRIHGPHVFKQQQGSRPAFEVWA